MKLGCVCVLLLALSLHGAVNAAPDGDHSEALLSAILKKNFDQFVKELQKMRADLNTPDSKGRMPLIEAVKIGDMKYIDSILQYGGKAQAEDPATGTTALHVAFQKNLPQVAYLLIKYGADPNTADKSGKKARDAATAPELHEMLQSYDNNGAEAFEDVPGTWIKSKGPSGEEFWFNVHTNESRWNTPPSCAWHRLPIHGNTHPYRYINALTQQELHRVPIALSWRKVKSQGQLMWYNYRINVTQFETPEELPLEMVKELEEEVNWRWVNPLTGDLSWEDPANHSPWRIVPHEDHPETPYYHNIVTGESTWEKPEELSWEQVQKDDQVFYHNPKTGESKWEAPPHMAWTKQHDEL